MMIKIQWEMRDQDREWIGSCNEMDARTIAQAQQWILKEVPRREHGNIEVDSVHLYEKGRFMDSDGEPANQRWLASYWPIVQEWTFANPTQQEHGK